MVMRKMLRTTLLMLALSPAAFAGNIQNGVAAPGEVSNDVTAAGHIECGATQPPQEEAGGEMQFPLAETILSLLALF